MAFERFDLKGGAHVSEFQASLDERNRDADALLAAGRHASAIAMGIYAVEICLKIAICRRLDIDQLPKPFQIHDLQGLLILTGLSRRMGRDERMKGPWEAIILSSSRLNQLRYGSAAEIGKDQALLIYGYVFGPDEGIIPWIKRHMPRTSSKR